MQSCPPDRQPCCPEPAEGPQLSATLQGQGNSVIAIGSLSAMQSCRPEPAEGPQNLPASPVAGPKAGLRDGAWVPLSLRNRHFPEARLPWFRSQGYRMNSDSVPSPLLSSFPRRRESRPPSYVPHNILLTVPWKFGQFGAHAFAPVQVASLLIPQLVTDIIIGAARHTPPAPTQPPCPLTLVTDSPFQPFFVCMK